MTIDGHDVHQILDAFDDAEKNESVKLSPS